MTSFEIELARFAVESDIGVDYLEPHKLSEDCRTAVAAMQEEGLAVHFLRCVHLPEYQSCVLLFEASSASLAEEAAQRGTGAAGRAVRLAGSVVGGEGLA